MKQQYVIPSIESVETLSGEALCTSTGEGFKSDSYPGLDNWGADFR